MKLSVRSAFVTLGALLLASDIASAQPAQSQQARSQFPEGARIAFVNLQYVFSATREGKTAATELQALQHKKNADITAKTKEVEALQQKLSQTGAALNDEARGRLERDVARAKVDFQRLVEDSEGEVQELQQQFHRAFSRKLFPVIGEVAKARDLWAVFNIGEANLIWHQSALDISDEIVARLDTPAKAPKE
jgi:outer membrane protein